MARQRVVKEKDGKWHWRLDLGVDPRTGKRRRPHVSHEIEEVAQQRLDQLVWQLARYGPDFVVIPKFLTTHQWFERWLVLDVGRPSTRPKHATQVQRWIQPWLGGTRLSKLTQRQLVDLLQAIPSFEEKLDCLETLRESLGSASRDGYVAENVAEGIDVEPAVARSIYHQHFVEGLAQPIDPGRVISVPTLSKDRPEQRRW